MLRYTYGPAFVVLIAILLVSCSGAGGCSGCAGCGLTPLPAGFPQASVIPNAASMRVTRPGLDFVAANAGRVAAKTPGTSGGVATFNVPDATTSFSILIVSINVEMCKPPLGTGQCIAAVDVAHAHLHVDAVTPHAIQITGTVPVKVNDIPVQTSLGGFDIGLGNGGCNGPNGSPSVDYANIPVSVTLPLVEETQTPRTGYTMIDAANATVNATIDTSVVQICDGGLLGTFLNLFEGFVVRQVTGPLTNALKSLLQGQLCTKPDTTVSPSCPDGTEVDGGNCVFQADPQTCLPVLLGLDGHLKLGAFLQKYAPGNAAAVDFVLAAAGDSDPAPDCQSNQLWTPGGGCAKDPNPPYDGHTPNGLTLGMLGGALASPPSACVPAAPNPIPQNIPIPDELTTDSIAPWRGGGGPRPRASLSPDISLAIANRFLNYAATSAYSSGALCLGMSTDTLPALNTGLVSAIIPSLKDLTFEPGKSSRPAAMAITTRPQRPPSIKLGHGTDVNADPLLSVTLPEFAIDFYVWSLDRFIRVLTYTADLTIPINLETGVDPANNPSGGILPVLGDLSAANGAVTSSSLLLEDPNQLGAALSSLLGSVVGQLLGKGFSPINVSGALSSYGVGISIPTGGFRKLTKGTDDFLGLFAQLTALPTSALQHAEAKAAIVRTEIHPEAMTLAGADRALFPKLWIALSSPARDATAPIEFAYWIDEQPRSAWSTAREVVASDQYLFLQGKHTLYVTARVVGQPATEDLTPEAIPFLIDVLSPSVRLQTTGSTVSVAADDFVSPAEALRGRYRLMDTSGAGDFGPWQPLAAMATLDVGSASALDVEVMDEAGNVAKSNQLIRGRPDPTLPAAASACGCSAPGAASGPSWAAGAGVLAALALAGLRRRRGTALAIGSLGVVAAGAPGCSCGGGGSGGGELMAAPPTGCGDDCHQVCGTPNQQGLIGEYTSIAVGPSGTIWVAGYNDADVNNAALYGDLVVGTYDAGKQRVVWQDVDGLPPPRTDGTCPPNDPATWRHGETDPGPDVGLWTSIQVDATGNPMVSYYDATNAALKYASSPDGGRTWTVHAVLSAHQSDIGRYSKLLLVQGKPVIGFLVVEPGTGGWARSRVVLATGKVPRPASASDWSLQDALVDEQTPCSAQLCAPGQVCVQSTMICQATVAGCAPSDCGASSASIGSTPQQCVAIMDASTCANVISSAAVGTYPAAVGDYVTMAAGPQGVGIVVYDRTRGNLVGVANRAGTWSAQILDGQTGANSDPNRVDTGDVGIGASLAIADNGDWHVSYVNGWTESLQYLLVPAGDLSKPLAPEVVDAGTALGGMPYPDGQHIVGDDSSVTVDSSGTVRIVYQDATAGALLEAIGTPGANDAHTWSVRALAQAGRFAGFFPHYVAQAQQVENWFRTTDHTRSPPTVSGDVALVAP
jgi:hypothetical protein